MSSKSWTWTRREPAARQHAGGPEAPESTGIMPVSGAAPAAPVHQPGRESHGERFERMFRELAPYVRRIMPRMGVAPADLDDVTQEVFLAIHRALPRFEGRSSERTWVYGICIRICASYRRRAYHRRERLMETPPEQGDNKTPERTSIARASLARLDAALEQLPDPQRAAFVLHEIEMLSVKEIAEALACSKFTVYTRLRVAQQRIVAAMGAPEHREVRHA